MPIAKRSNPVEGHTGSGTSVATSAFATSPVTGDTIVVFEFTGAISNTHQAPTDTAGNTYTQIGTTLNGSQGLSLWKCENCTGGSSFVVTGHLSGVDQLTVIAWCLSGAQTPTSYNGDSVGTTGSSANPASGTSSPAPAANSFFIAGAVGGGADNAMTAGSGWEFVTGSTQPDNTAFQAAYTEELTSPNTSSTAQNGLFVAVANPWAARVVSFAPATVTLTLEQEGYRWRNDDGSETTATWKAAQDTNVTVVPDQIARLRMILNTTGDAPNETYKLQYRKVGASSWRDLDKFV